MNSPGTDTPFAPSVAFSQTGVTLNGVDDASVSSSKTVVLTSPGATLTGTSSLARGNGAAAAASVAGSVILSGITESDLEKDAFESTRHGHTLSGIFRARLMVLPTSVDDEEGADANKCMLVLVVPTEVEEEDQVQVIANVRDIFESAKLGLELDVEFEDLYDITIEVVQNDDDTLKVMEIASTAAANHKLPPTLSIPSTVISTYTKMSSTSEPSPCVASAILSCDESLTRHYRTARAKLTAWRSRTQRGLTVDHFGSLALQLTKRATEQYDRDTILAAGLAGSTAAPYRLEGRARLTTRIDTVVRELFQTQVTLLEASTLKRFEAVLLRRYKGGGGNEDKLVDTEYDDNAAAVRTALFAFDTAMEDLVVPSLSLTKAKATREMTVKLETALLTFPDGAAARLKSLREVAKAANREAKQKEAKPNDRSVNLGLDLVSMVRPDGFGSLQGFVGYQYGGNNVIVGIHNDADSPDVISQFGGTRPPFLRIQPKLKVDIEL